MKRTKWVVLLSAAILSAAIIMTISSPRLAASADKKPSAGAEVKIDNFSFGPQTLTVSVGIRSTLANETMQDSDICSRVMPDHHETA